MMLICELYVFDELVECVVLIYNFFYCIVWFFLGFEVEWKG